MSTAGKEPGVGPRASGAGAGLALGALVVGVVAMMIVPLPTWLLDGLITLNIGASVALLLGAAWSRDAAAASTFPALLLLTTLFRLALNVSTVRLILLQADAGRVVRAFGWFVVRGDYVVGGAVFLVLTIVQYLVIARGAQRVAEVAARFTLDALPGKQLAIDADLRAGAIDAIEARARREELAREARLHGALDGAMRFVRGDAVAAMVILAVSMFGGLAIGVLRRGLPIGEAAKVYTLLTIGDGLVSQLPALLVASAAALVVTRVDPDRGSGSFAATVGRQFFGRPRVLLWVAALLGILALLPGLPLMPFSVVALLFALAAAVVAGRPAQEPAGRAPLLLPSPTAAVEVVVHPPAGQEPAIRRALDDAAQRFVADLGVPLERPSLRIDAALSPRAWQVRIHGLTVADGTMEETDGAGSLAEPLDRALRRAAHELLGLDETQRLLDRLAEGRPALVREVVPRRIDVATLTAVLRRLLAEGLGIGDLREILEAIAPLRSPGGHELERDPALLTERVREGLRRQISGRLAPDKRMVALLLDPLVEEAIRGALRPGAAGTVLALEPSLAGEILVGVSRALAARAPAHGADGTRRPVILTSPELRRHVRRLVEGDHPEVAVISWQELSPDTRVEQAGRIAVGE